MYIEEAVKQPCILAASGGLDSAFALWHATDQAQLLHCDFGSSHEVVQREALRRQLNFLDKNHLVLHERAKTPSNTAYREAISLMIGVAKETGVNVIVTGDCLRSRADGYTTDQLTVDLLENEGIILAAKSQCSDLKSAYLSMPQEYLGLTWSCVDVKHSGDAWHKCGWCSACKIHQRSGLWSVLPQSMPKEV